MSFSPISPTSTSGTATLGSGFTVASNNVWTDTGLSVTLPAAGTYLLSYTAQTNITSSTAGALFYTKLYNSTDAVDVTGTVQRGSYTSTAGPNYLATQSVTVVLTVTASKVIKLYGNISPAGTVLQRTIDIANITYVQLA